jgi:hypothetical protein
MKAAEAWLLDFAKRSPQPTIPLYQRTYSWAEPTGSMLRDPRCDEYSACTAIAPEGSILEPLIKGRWHKSRGHLSSLCSSRFLILTACLATIES